VLKVRRASQRSAQLLQQRQYGGAAAVIRELEVDWGTLVPGTNTAEGAASTSDPSQTHPKVLHPIL
jgi:hypothetical protein